jgi:hypothetical protein
MESFDMRNFDDFNGDLKIVLFPEDQNKVIVRVENIADLFDGTPEENPQFDLLTFT